MGIIAECGLNLHHVGVRMPADRSAQQRIESRPASLYHFGFGYSGSKGFHPADIQLLFPPRNREIGVRCTPYMRDKRPWRSYRSMSR